MTIQIDIISTKQLDGHLVTRLVKMGQRKCQEKAIVEVGIDWNQVHRLRHAPITAKPEKAAFDPGFVLRSGVAASGASSAE